MSTGFFIGKPVAYTTQESEQSKLDNLLEVFRFKSIPSEEIILALDRGDFENVLTH